MSQTDVEVDDVDREAIADQIKKGCTSGHLDSEDGKRIYWEITINVWKD